ncbi:hypothetical protein D0T92_04090 [Neisseria zalophi]|uniref:TNase-like domain-containing protein n=2 Tax=Neisseria zalophi TaxID=640030 RepID=A0A5J6PSS8_9NEIS|nr:hypothetical protein D0T92_04090 [Neisseria zalophi]
MGVADGDTLTCLSSEKVPIKVRLNQIDAPEHKQDFGKAAKKALSAYFLEEGCCLRILYIRNYNFNYKNR